jgi:hypothetical protein
MGRRNGLFVAALRGHKAIYVRSLGICHVLTDMQAAHDTDGVLSQWITDHVCRLSTSLSKTSWWINTPLISRSELVILSSGLISETTLLVMCIFGPLDAPHSWVRNSLPLNPTPRVCLRARLEITGLSCRLQRPGRPPQVHDIPSD